MINHDSISTEILKLSAEATDLLKQLIATPSFSKEENGTAILIERFLTERGIQFTREGNNVYALNRHFSDGKPTILLNSHHDTVKPNPQYTRDPFATVIEDGKLYGLGSNDAGGCLVSLIAAFSHLYERDGMKYNLVLAATAEEEISGSGGIEMILPLLPEIECAMVGEPTKLELAVAERGLMVIDCKAHGKAGHAARHEGENAIYIAMEDINWFRTFSFPKNSELLGPCKMSVTSIETSNKAHNVVPATCDFIVDVRVNEQYSFEEILDIIRKNVKSEVTPRSMRLRSTSIPMDHALVKAGISLGGNCYGSPTTSDKALMSFPALKVGPGDSARSHTADEFIYVDEITTGIKFYLYMLEKII